MADLLGFDIRKPAELCHYFQDHSKLYRTEGWFHFVGNILSGRDAWMQISETSSTADLAPLTISFDFGFTDNVALVSKPFMDKHLVQLEFVTHVPRVLPESNWLIPNP